MRPRPALLVSVVIVGCGAEQAHPQERRARQLEAMGRERRHLPAERVVAAARRVDELERHVELARDDLQRHAMAGLHRRAQRLVARDDAADGAPHGVDVERAAQAHREPHRVHGARALEHQAGNLQHRQAADGDQHDRNDADVAKRFHAARPLALLRSEKACAATATALAGDSFGVSSSGSGA